MSITLISYLSSFFRIISITIHDDEIFILESPRCLIRIASKPEGCYGMAMTNSINFTITNPAHLFSIPTIETDTETEIIVKAEECFELPPIKQLDLNDISRLELNSYAEVSHHEKKSMLLEHSKKVELYDKINIHKYNDSILFKSKTQKKHKHSDKTNKICNVGIVEIGQQPKIIEDIEKVPDNEVGPSNDLESKEVTVRPSLLDVSFFEYVR